MNIEFEKVEQIVEKTGCSYTDAKEALERSGENLLDAIIYLEESGKTKKASASIETEGGTIPATEAEVIKGEDAERLKNEAFGSESNAGAGKKKCGGAVKRFFRKLRDILMNNRMTVAGKSGSTIMDVPLIVPVMFLILGFSITIIIGIIALLAGCRISFYGENLGSSGINKAMDKASEVAEKVKNEFTDDGGEDTDN